MLLLGSSQRRGFSIHRTESLRSSNAACARDSRLQRNPNFRCVTSNVVRLMFGAAGPTLAPSNSVAPRSLASPQHRTWSLPSVCRSEGGARRRWQGGARCPHRNPRCARRRPLWARPSRQASQLRSSGGHRVHATGCTSRFVRIVEVRETERGSTTSWKVRGLFEVFTIRR